MSSINTDIMHQKKKQVKNTGLNSPVSHSLNKEWLVLSHGPAASLFRGVVHSKHVVSIDTDGQHAVTWASSSCWAGERMSSSCKGSRSQRNPQPRVFTDAVAPVLLVGGGRDGVAVVTAEEDHRALEGGGEVEAGVCVAFAGRPLSKVTDDGTVQVFPLDGVRGTSG